LNVIHHFAASFCWNGCVYLMLAAINSNMLNFNRRKLSKQFDTDMFGILHLHNLDSIYSWTTVCQPETFSNDIELELETPTDEPPLPSQLGSLKNFLVSYSDIRTKLLDRIFEAYYRTEFKRPRSDFDNMYHLAAVNLKIDGSFWVVSEPEDVESVYNHFMRFTIKQGDILWSNVS
jgi:hypothetical protein